MIGIGQFRALLVHGFGNPPGDRPGAGDADDERTLSFEKSHLLFLCR
jgi:hypothetical protein